MQCTVDNKRYVS